MKPAIIVYTSETGHTARYAALLSQKLDLPCVSLSQYIKSGDKTQPAIYMGWLFASHIKEYKKAAKHCSIAALCAVGLCPTGELLSEIRTAEKLPDAMPLFTLQGGMDHAELRGLHKWMIRMLIKMLSAKKNADEKEAAMLQLIRDGGDFVDEKHLADVLAWYHGLDD